MAETVEELDTAQLDLAAPVREELEAGDEQDEDQEARGLERNALAREEDQRDRSERQHRERVRVRERRPGGHRCLVCVMAKRRRATPGWPACIAKTAGCGQVRAAQRCPP